MNIIKKLGLRAAAAAAGVLLAGAAQAAPVTYYFSGSFSLIVGAQAAVLPQQWQCAIESAIISAKLTIAVVASDCTPGGMSDGKGKAVPVTVLPPPSTEMSLPLMVMRPGFGVSAFCRSMTTRSTEGACAGAGGADGTFGA